MGKMVKYGEFEFPESFGFKGSAGKTMVKAYARGGGVKSDMAQDKAVCKTAVGKHESNMHPGKPKTKLAVGGPVASPGNMGVTMAPSPGNKRPVAAPRGGMPMRKPGVPVAPKGPVIGSQKTVTRKPMVGQTPPTRQLPTYAKGGMCSGGSAKYKK